MIGKARCAAFLCLLAMTSSCELMEPDAGTDAPAPMKPDVPPIRNCAIRILVTSSYSYPADPQEEREFRTGLPDSVVAHLNAAGMADGNTFAIASGEAHNFTFHYNFTCDQNDRITGSLTFSGWGWDYINTFSSGEYSFSRSDGGKMYRILTDKAYSFIHLGWHDTRKN